MELRLAKITSMSRIDKYYKLKPESIDQISSLVQKFLIDNGFGKEIYIRMGLVIEETLLNLHDELGEKIEVGVHLSKSFGRPSISIDYRSKGYNPSADNTKDYLSNIILNNIGIISNWSYRFGLNTVSFKLPYKGPRNEILLISALLLSLICGVIGPYIPLAIRDRIINYFLDPASDFFMKALSVLAPMLIFLSTANGIIRSKDGADFSKIGKYIISRYIGATALMCIIFTAFTAPWFDLKHAETAFKLSSFRKLYDMILNMFPGNIITPFAENNMMQVIILAVFFGIVILGQGNRVGHLIDLMSDLHKVFSSAVDFICHLLPIFIFTSLTSILWKNGLDNFAKLWKPIVVAIVAEYVLVFIYFAFVSIKFHVSVFKLIKKVMPSFLVAVTTSSSIATFTVGNELNKTKLGIKAQYTDLAYPLGISLYDAPFLPLFLTIAFYLAEFYKTDVSLVWFITAGFICFIVCYASPQVSGGTLICLGVILGQLGIPMEGLAIAGTLALILDFFGTGAKVAAQHMEMIIQAGHLDMVDVEELRK